MFTYSLRIKTEQKVVSNRHIARLLLSFCLLLGSLLPTLAFTTFEVAQAAPAPTATPAKAATSLVNSTTTAQTLDAAAQQKAQATFTGLPLSIEANQGQVSDPNVKYVARGQNFGVSFTQNGAYIGLTNPALAGCNANQQQPDLQTPQDKTDCKSGQTDSSMSVVQLSLAGASTNAHLVASLPQTAKSNYFSGEQSNWHTDIATYGLLTYQNAYSGIDLTYSGSRSQLQYAFMVAPGADASQIRLSFDGADSVQVENDGSLTIHTQAGSLHQATPSFYQAGSTTSSHLAVRGRYVSTGKNSIGFSPASYDHSQPLTIAPTLEFATFLGGGGNNYTGSIAIDGNGNIYIAGSSGGGLPATTGAYQATSKGSNMAFVAEFNPSASGSASLVYLSYLGGNRNSGAQGIAVDSSGNIYLTGYTYDNNFPVSASAYQTINKGFVKGRDEAFFTKLNPNGSGSAQLVYSTYLGGSYDDIANAIALDSSNNAYITGYTFSNDFPTSSNAYSATKTITTSNDAFIAEINPSGSGAASLLYSTFLGGSGTEIAFAIAVSNSKIYVTGLTSSSDFPTSANAYQPTSGGANDVFVSELDPSQSGAAQLIYSTYLGGSSYDQANGIAVYNNKIYLTGDTYSSNFPTTTNAYQATNGGNYDAFVTELDPSQVVTSSQLIYSTYLGGNSNDQAKGIAVNNGKIYLVGLTSSSNFPTSANAYQPAFGGISDVFVTELDPSQVVTPSQLIYSTYLGGNSYDYGEAIAVDSSGNIYLAGLTQSYSGPGNTGFPTTSTAYQTNSLSLQSVEGFVTKLNPNAASTAAQLVYSSYLSGSFGSQGDRIASDSLGNIYVTGYSIGGFPTTASAYQSSYGGKTDVYIAEFNPTLTRLLYSSYLGGSDQDEPNGIAVDSAGNIYVTGNTYSNALTNTVGGSNLPFPTTANAFQTINNGGPNNGVVSFLTKLNPQASGTAQLVYSTFFGGSNDDQAGDIAVDNSGHAYLTGQTFSNDFPITANAYQITSTQVISGNGTGFVSKFDTNASGSASLLYSSYFGNLDGLSQGEQGNGIALDNSGNVYLTGYTYSSHFPTTTNAIQPTYKGSGNNVGFVSKLNLAASGAAQLLYSSYLGSAGTHPQNDFGTGIAVDNSGNAYVTGNTRSSDFLTTTNAYQPTYGGNGDAFLSVISPTAATGPASLLYSTYLGGSGYDEAHQVKVDANGNAYIGGYSISNNLNTNTPYPTTANAFQSTNNAPSNGANAIVSKINPRASGTASLLYSTYLGGSNFGQEEDDQAYALALDSVGSVLLTGFADSPDFPGVSSGYQPAPGGVSSSFAAKLVLNSLNFSTQPVGGVAGQALTTQPVVTVVQPDGTTAYAYNGPVTLTIQSGTGTAGAALGGTTIVNAVNGIATFTNLAINLAGNGYVLTAAVVNNLLPSVSSNVFNVTVAPSTLTVSPASLTFSTTVGSSPSNQNLTLNAISNTLTYNSAISYTSGTSGWLLVTPISGTVTPGTPVTPTASVNSNSLIAGTYTALVSFSNTSYVTDSVKTVPVTLTVVAVAPTSTTTSLTSNPNPSTVGQSVTFTATVSPATASGTVTFTDSISGTLGTAAVISGTATYPTSNLTSGTHTITATYGGNGSYSGSFTTTVQVVNPATITPTTYTYYLPFLSNGLNNYTTYPVFQNVGTASTTVSVTFYDSNGTPLATQPTLTGTCNPAPQYGECILPNPYNSTSSGSAVIVSAQPLNVLIPEGTAFGGSAYAISSGASGSLIAPLALNNTYGDFKTQILVYNGGPTPANVTLKFYNNDGTPAPASSTQTVTIQPKTSTTLDQSAATSGLPNGFTGWAQITGNDANSNKLVAQVLEQSLSRKFVAIANAQSSLRNTVYAPAIFNQGYGSFITGANIVNPNGSAVTVTVSYYNLSGAISTTMPFVLNAKAVAGVFQGGTSGNGLPNGGLPLNYVGAATVSATGPIVMLVNEDGGLTGTGNERSGTYAANVGSSSVGLPAIANGAFGGYVTGATILNTSSSPVSATLAFYNLDGSSAGNTQMFSIGGNASQAFYQGASSLLAAGFYGTAVVNETSGPANALIVTTNAQNSALFYTYSEPNS